jgi:uncharacterized protein
LINIQAHAQGSIVAVHAQPGAKRDAIKGTHGDALRISVIAPPEDGRANQAIAGMLAKALGCREAEITLLSGHSHRSKRFLVVGRMPDEVRQRLEALIVPLFSNRPRE